MIFLFCRHLRDFLRVVVMGNLQTEDRASSEEILSAYHLYGKPGNSGENSNGTVHSGGMFSEKR